MGAILEKMFPDPTTFPGGVNCGRQDWPVAPNVTTVLPGHCSEDSGFGFFQVLLITLFYGAVLFYASNQISDGSEKLLWIPSWRGLVGTVVLPVLGAVPDGAIVLFSGLGPNAQEELSVGVGALAGSTIMLLTVGWSASVVAGRVDTNNASKAYRSRPKLTRPWDLWTTGVIPQAELASNANIMLGTAMGYLFVQGAAFGSGSNGMADPTPAELEASRRAERFWVLITMIFTAFFFFAYLVAMYKQAGAEDTHTTQETRLKLADAVKDHKICVVALFYEQVGMFYLTYERTNERTNERMNKRTN